MTNISLLLCLTFSFYVTESTRLMWSAEKQAQDPLIYYDDEDDYVYFKDDIKTTTTTEMTEETREKASKKVWMECIDETNVDPEFIIVLRYSSERRLWDKNYPSVKKWAHCVLTKRGLMSKHGVFSMDKAREVLQKEDMKIAEQVIDNCLSPVELPPEDLSWTYAKCHHNSKYGGRLKAIGLFQF